MDNSMTWDEAMQTVCAGYTREQFERRALRELSYIRKLVDEKAVVLDFGCGIGRITKVVAPLVKYVIACDVSDRMLEFTKQRCSGIDNIKYVNNLDGVATGLVDICVTFLVFQHFSKHTLLKSLHEIGRVLKDKGLLFTCNSFSVNPHDMRTLLKEKGFTILNAFSEVEETGAFRDEYILAQKGRMA